MLFLGFFTYISQAKLNIIKYLTNTPLILYITTILFLCTHILYVIILTFTYIS